MTQTGSNHNEEVETATVTHGTVQLDGQVVVVTGATGVAGRAVCRALQDHGASVIAIGRNIETLEQLQAELPQPLLDRYVVDLSNNLRCQSVFKDIGERHHGISAVTHLVGGWRTGGVERYNSADLTWLFEQLVITMANVTSAARPLLVSGSGKFIHVSSPVTRNVTSRNAAYASAKAAADIWATSLAFALVGTQGAVTTFEVKAFYDDASVEDSPDQLRDGFTHVNDFALAVVKLWSQPATTERVSLL